jgi:hypothetical protein
VAQELEDEESEKAGQQWERDSPTTLCFVRDYSLDVQQYYVSSSSGIAAIVVAHDLLMSLDIYLSGVGGV